MSEIVEVADPAVIEVVYEPTRVVEVVREGPRGPVGPIADLNVVLAAVDGAVSDYFVLHPQSWTYEQTTAVYRWGPILHPLDHHPAVVVTDSAGTVWLGAVSYPDDQHVIVDFNVPLAGTATLT